MLNNITIAQVRATTEDGRKVLLLDNGTWKYEDLTDNTPVVAAVTVLAPAIAVDSSRETTTDPEDLIYTSSPRLVRFFGESGSNIRCKVSASNTQGTIKLKFIWEFPVADANRYFGAFKEGTKVVFTMTNDQQLEIVMGDENENKRLEKHNYAVISNNSFPLTAEQLTVLSTKSISKIEVDWKKNTEEYSIEKMLLVQEMLSEIL